MEMMEMMEVMEMMELMIRMMIHHITMAGAGMGVGMGGEGMVDGQAWRMVSVPVLKGTMW
ncbi:uncharacterized protein K444DRAFT_621957 [Hyaloscypha bicolor E]|uniref:Uncharacterized protein n=1 Tax=Hyaloscypha bicolor E TaxID=1095630 RepID=A0A2J6SIJ3_9HELO|nr:uncharacterized protein K444DRAFT_621957 [Hyaloscypha bicolor E]PMD50588.1 hypothetical protein K444DRAFT_621957 [Hyaloscypha bicolor E]